MEPQPTPAERFLIREATAPDVETVARLHVTTFIETHGGPGPTFELRQSQWREAFANRDRRMFCFLAARGDGDPVGFARGVPYPDGLPGYDGELNKIYVLREYHRRGLGRRLLCHVARRFLQEGITSMLLFGDARSPSNGFYEHLGAGRLLSPAGEFHGGYGWTDLRHLAARCPNER